MRRVRLWPTVQARQTSAVEFGAALLAGSSGRASGVMMSTIGVLAGEPAKLAVLKKVFRGPNS